MIADKIKNARTIKKLTQEQVAEDLNVSRQTISNWENGKSLPDIVSIIRMSELYDLSLDELLKGNETLLNKIERDMKVAKAENNVIKFAWISIVIGVVMIILGNVFDGNPFIDFISAALPWVLLGLMMLFAILYLNKENDNQRDELIICKSISIASYTADYEDFSDTEYLFGGTSIKREAGKELSIDCTLEVTEGTAKVFWISGSDKAVTLIETTGTYSDTITLPDGGNYVGIECESFTGSIELNIE